MMEALVFIGLVVVGTVAITRAALRGRARRQAVVLPPHSIQPTVYMSPPPPPTRPGGIGTPGRHAAVPPRPVAAQVDALERKLALYHEYVFVRGDACTDYGRDQLLQLLGEIDA